MPLLLPPSFPGSIKRKGNVNSQNAFQLIPSTLDGTNYPGQGSTNAGILAAGYVTVSGTTPTLVYNKNVASVTRMAQGIYKIVFSSALSDAYYGVLINGRNTANTQNLRINPSRNTTYGSLYSNTEFQIRCEDNAGNAADPPLLTFIVFDCSALGADYLAAYMATISSTVATLRDQLNVSSLGYNSQGLYTVNFNSALSNAEYCNFASSRYADSASNNATPSKGCYSRDTTGSKNRQTINLVDNQYGYYNGGISDHPYIISGLIRSPNSYPRGTVGSVRFTVSAGVCSIVSSWNVSSVTYISTGLYRINFIIPINNTEYAAYCSGKFTDAASNVVPQIDMSTQTGGSTWSTTQLDICANNPGFGPTDITKCDVWVVKPWVM